MEKMYHVGFDDTHGAKYVILPGDPGRVEKIAQFLDEPHFYCQHREYTTWLGKVDGETVMVMSTGMGGPSTAIGVEECYKTGVRTFIRIGTTGGINLKVMGGDLVIANSAIRMEGTTREYMPIEFPAVADHDVTCALIQAAKNLGARWHVGTVQCKDAFYGQHEPDRLPVGPMLEYKWECWKKGGTLSSEMESAALYVVCATLEEARAGCILNVCWNQERKKLGLPDPEQHDTALACQAAVGAVRLLIQQDKEAAGQQ